MKPLSDAVLRSGLVPQESLDELKKWKMPVDTESEGPSLEALDEITATLADALNSREQVEIRGTDLDVLRRWLDKKNQQEGRLYLIEDGRKSSSKCIYCRDIMGGYVFPWAADTIVELLTNGESHLKVETPEGDKAVYFSDVKELYYGVQKMFVLCVPFSGSKR